MGVTKLKFKDKNQASIDSIISNGVEMKGQINAKGSIRMDGTVEGTIIVQGDVIVGEKGRIKGEIKAENLVIAGKMEGNATVKGRIEITSKGIVNGDISCSTILIEEGGILEGSSKMIKSDSNKENLKTNENRKKG